MSHRQEDILHVQEQVRGLEAERDRILRDFEVVRARVSGEVQALEARVADLNAVREYLLKLERESRPPEIINGINVSRLDFETRLRVEEGNPETIEALLSAGL